MTNEGSLWLRALAAACVLGVAGSGAAAMGGKELQEVLTALGYKPGRIDGKPGPKTREALKQFQKDAGLPATGVLDAETTHRLRAAPAKR